MEGCLTTRRTFGLEIAGLGDTATGLPIRLSPDAVTLAGSLYAPVLANWPDIVSNEIDILEGTTSQSTISMVVGGLDNTTYGPQLRRFLTTSRPLPVYKLKTAVTSASLTWNVLLEPGETAPALNTTLFLEREAARVTAIAAVAGREYNLTVTRGLYGTTSVSHGIGSFDDGQIFDQNMIVTGRETALYELAYDTPAETLVWEGFLELPSSDSLVEIVLPMRDNWASTASRKFGKDRAEGLGVFSLAEESRQPVIARGAWGSVGVDFILPNDPARLLAEDDRLHVMYKGWILPAQTVKRGVDRSNNTRRYMINPTDHDNVNGSYVAANDTDLTGDELPTHYGGYNDGPIPPGLVVEVLLSDADNPYVHFADSAGVASDHPLDVLRCLLVSTGEATWSSGGARVVGSNGSYDWLPSPWGLGIDDGRIDHTGIDSLKASALYSGLRMSNMILGLDGEDEVSDVITKICKSCFMFPTTASDGKLTFATITDPGGTGTIATVVESDLWMDPPVQLASRFTPVSTVKIDMANRGATEKPDQEMTQLDFAERNDRRYPHLTSDDDIDCGWFGFAGGLSGIDDNSLTKLLGLFSIRWALQNGPLPEYRFRVKPGFTKLNPGAVIEFSCSNLFNEDGDRDVTSHRCIVAESAFSLEDFTQELTVIDLFPLTRADGDIAPAWKISAVTDSTHFQIEHFAYSAEDWTRFTSFALPEEIELYDRYGVLKTTGPTTVTSFIAPNVVLAVAWSDGAPVTPIVGDVIRIPKWDDATAPQKLLWAWNADSNGELGAGNDEPDRWGI